VGLPGTDEELEQRRARPGRTVRMSNIENKMKVMFFEYIIRPYII
jgi:hypothetical protein